MYTKILLLISLLLGITTSSYSTPLLKSLKIHAKVCRTQGGMERLLQSSKTYHNPSQSCFTLMQAKKVEVLGYYTNAGLIDKYYKIYYHNTVHYVRARDISIGSDRLALQQSEIGKPVIAKTISTSHQVIVHDIPTLDTTASHTKTISKQNLHETLVPTTTRTYIAPKRSTKQVIKKAKKTSKLVKRKKVSTSRNRIKPKKVAYKTNKKKTLKKKKIDTRVKKRKSKRVRRHLKYTHKKTNTRKRRKSKIYHCKARSQSATGWAKSIYLQDAKNKAYKECTKRNISPLACFVEVCYEEW